jgi:hypothetical protein
MNKNKYFSLIKIDKIFLIFFLLAATIGMYSFIKSYSFLLLKNTLNTRVILNECNLSAKANIGCIAYIDNLIKNKRINIFQPVKKLNNLSIYQFEKLYQIGLFNPNNGKLYKTYNFTFLPNSEFVHIYSKEKNKNKDKYLKLVNKIIEINVNDQKFKILKIYQVLFNKFYLNYYYSSKKITLKDITGQNYKNKKIIPFFENGFQFVGSCSFFSDMLKGKKNCQKSKYILRLIKIKRNKNEE